MAKASKQTQLKREHKPKNPNLRNKAYKFRLYPTQKQIGKLEWTLRRCKELYNAVLEERREAYRYAVIADALCQKIFRCVGTLVLTVDMKLTGIPMTLGISCIATASRNSKGQEVSHSPSLVDELSKPLA